MKPNGLQISCKFKLIKWNKGQMKIEEWRWICILNLELKRKGWRLMLQYLRDSVTHISFSSLLENNIGILS